MSLLFLISCAHSPRVLKTQWPHSTYAISIEQNLIPLQYEPASSRPLNQQEKSIFTSAVEAPFIWTLQPTPWPSKMLKPEEHTLSYPSLSPPTSKVNTSNVNASSPIELDDSIHLSQKSSSEVLSAGEATIYGPSERYARDKIILRAQLQSPQAASHLSWKIWIDKAQFSPPVKNFDFTPPPYSISHNSRFQTEIDRFFYTQLSLDLHTPPFPVYLNSKVLLSDSSHHSILIHPSSTYIGISAPQWAHVNKTFSVQSITVKPDGTPKEADKFYVMFVGGQNIQICQEKTCHFSSERIGWHQIIATAQDEKGRTSQSYKEIFLYGSPNENPPKILLSQAKDKLLIQSDEENSELLLGYLSGDELYLEGHQLSDGFLIKETQHPIQKAKALLLGKDRFELDLSTTKSKPPSPTPVLKSKAMTFSPARFSHPSTLWLSDEGQMQILFPGGPSKKISISSQHNKIHLPQKDFFVQKSTLPTILSIPLHARHTGDDELLIQIHSGEMQEYKRKLTVHASYIQPSIIQHGTLRTKNSTAGTQIKLSKGTVSVHTDTHGEGVLLRYLLPYLFLPPNIDNRIKRLQVVPLCWDALYHSQDAHAMMLIEQVLSDQAWLSEQTQHFDVDQSLQWLRALISLSHAGLHVSSTDVLPLLSRLNQAQLSDTQMALFLYLKHRGQRLPIKPFFPTIDLVKTKALFDRLPVEDRLWLIPILEKNPKIRHWVYVEYDRLVQQNAARLLEVFYKIREYRYRLPTLTENVSKKQHEGLIAQALHAKDKKNNRYGLHAFLWKDDTLFTRGSHRRRGYDPIGIQDYFTQPHQLTLTTRGEGKLRFFVSWRPNHESTPAKGNLVTQSYFQKDGQRFLQIEFDILQAGSYWIFDQLPSFAKLQITKKDWIEQFEQSKTSYWIRTKSLKPGRYQYTMAITTPYTGQYIDPPVLLFDDKQLVGQSASIKDIDPEKLTER